MFRNKEDSVVSVEMKSMDPLIQIQKILNKSIVKSITKNLQASAPGVDDPLLECLQRLLMAPNGIKPALIKIFQEKDDINQNAKKMIAFRQ